MATLEGHKNVVYAIAFNNPFGCVRRPSLVPADSPTTSPRPCSDKIVTGSFDKTAKVWDAGTGECLHTYKGGCGLWWRWLLLRGGPRGVDVPSLSLNLPSHSRTPRRAQHRDRVHQLRPPGRVRRDGVDGQQVRRCRGGKGGGRGVGASCHRGAAPRCVSDGWSFRLAPYGAHTRATPCGMMMGGCFACSASPAHLPTPRSIPLPSLACCSAKLWDVETGAALSGGDGRGEGRGCVVPQGCSATVCK